MANFIKMKVPTESGLLDVRPLLNRLQNTDEKVWREDTYLRDYPQGPFGDTESIILRFPPRSVHETEEALKNHEAHFDEHENVWQPCAKDFPEFTDIVYQMAYHTKATRIGRVMINKLKDKGEIYEHADTPSHANYWCRFHVVVGALPGCEFWCVDEMVEMTTGEVWFFRNELKHKVINNSGVPRIHMIVDLKIAEIK